MEKKPEIKAGQLWRTRNGRYVRISSHVAGSHFPWVGGHIQGPTHEKLNWSSSGGYGLGFEEHDLDLAVLVGNANVGGVIVEIKPGQLWMTRNGLFARVKAVEPGVTFCCLGFLLSKPSAFESWTASGGYSLRFTEHELDLVDLVDENNAGVQARADLKARREEIDAG